MFRRSTITSVLLVTFFACEVTPAAPATAPAPTNAAQAPRVRAEMPALLKALQDADPLVRRRAATRAKNFAGDFADAVEQASKDEALGDEARDALRAALPLIQRRAREKAAVDAVRDNDVKDQLDCYEKFGKKDPRWDALVRQAIGMGLGAAGEAPAGRVVATYKKAVDAGCDDPLVLYLYARAEWLAGTGDREEVLERHRDAAAALATGPYPAEWKCRAAARYIDQTGARHEQLLTVCYDTLPAALAETKRGKDDVRVFVQIVYGALSRVNGPQKAFEAIYGPYAKACPDESGPYVFKGQRFADYAWEARGTGLADTVAPAQWRVFYQ
jgi:hypothetical protein